MGNYTSACDCNFMISPRMKSNRAARVIFPTGEIRRFQESVKAAEVMIECPNFFLVNSQSLNINRRFSALSADEELESGNVYVMFPMRRMNSMVTPADLAVLWMEANSARKLVGGKMSLELEKSGCEKSMVEDEVEEWRKPLLDAVLEAPEMPEFSYRLMVCRSRKPLLDTIVEETVFCR